MSEENLDKTNNNDPKENKPLSKQEKIKFFIKETVETVVIVLVLVVLIRAFIGEPRWIPSSSMEPTLQIKDNLIVEKVSRYFTKPHRGDILVFFPPQKDKKLDPSLWGRFTRSIGFFSSDEAYIKRVIGLPGDEIRVVPNVGVYINDKLLKEPYIKEVFNGECRPDMYCGPLIIPQHSYYMMGDNRNDSTDSRYWGFLPQKTKVADYKNIGSKYWESMPEERIVGRACFRFWPITRIGPLQRPKYN